MKTLYIIDEHVWQSNYEMYELTIRHLKKPGLLSRIWGRKETVGPPESYMSRTGYVWVDERGFRVSLEKERFLEKHLRAQLHRKKIKEQPRAS